MIKCIQIDRLVISEEKVERVELHGFSEASEVAYGACIYLRSIDVQGKITTKLFCSKSRVAPIKRLSLPRLELCAAVFLADMYQASSRALKISFNKIRFWTDSMVVLAWLGSPAARWKTFVANRVSHIQETTTVEDWNHISSKENPADLVSRGADANTLSKLSLWWNGPNWLQQVETYWPRCEEVSDIREERKTARPIPIVSLVSQPSQEELFTKFSSWNKLQRITAYCLRFLHNCRHQRSRLQGNLSSSELREATIRCINRAQMDCFKQEKADLLEKGGD